MEYYFSKEYLEEPFVSFMREIGKVDYLLIQRKCLIL